MSASSNKFGNLFQWTTFGESHGPAMGVVIDGCPAGLEWSQSLLEDNLRRRRPGSHNTESPGITSDRKEQDMPKVLSGIFENATLGTPIAILVENQDQRSQDYSEIKNNPRTGHADDLWQSKFGVRDYRGGGRASARETLNWVMAGSVAQMFCLSQHKDFQVNARITHVGELAINSTSDLALVEMLEAAKKEGESYGGVIEVEIRNPQQGLGEPIFKKIKSELAAAFMTINACNGVEFGGGFAIAKVKGTQVHTTASSGVYGGIRGGMSTGETIKYRLAFKPTSSISKIAKEGRHDPCVAIRAVPVVEAMAWSVLADQILMKRLNRL